MRRANSRALIGATLFSASLLGCGADAPIAFDESLDARSDSIVNGTPTDGDPAVVGLSIQGQVFCTATLITPSIVLTAAHCLPPHVPYPVSQISVLFGSGPQVDDFIPAFDSWSHPAWNDNNLIDDIGLLQMQAVGPAEPIALNTTQLSIGTTVRVVGFGTTQWMGNDSGTKREGSSQIVDQNPFVMQIGSAPSITCSGDSGGPAFVAGDGGETLAGIHSRSNCANGADDTRVDAYLDDINAFISTHPEPTCEADGFCAAPCEGEQVDPDCPCFEDGLCTAACPDAVADPDCASACGPDGECVETCGIPDPDCQVCVADGVCDPGCPDDPDCAVDPECDPATECCDGDCAEDDGAEDGPLIVEQGPCGCHVVGVPERSTRGWVALIGLVALGARSRRRLG